MTLIPRPLSRTKASRTVMPSILFTAMALGAVGLAFAHKQFIMPPAQPAASYPAHDAHPDEKVTVAADPYDAPPKSDIFYVKWADHDLLPILVVITNDGDSPIPAGNMQVQFITAGRTKINPATNDDLYRRLSNPKDPQRKIPLPLPTGRAKGSVNSDTLDEIDRSQFAAKAIEPHTTRSGFFYFDVSGITRPVPGSRVFITGIRASSGAELFYFEIPMSMGKE